MGSARRRKYFDRFFAECGLLLSADCLDWLIKEIKTSPSDSHPQAGVDDGAQEEEAAAAAESVVNITVDELMGFLLKARLTWRLSQPGTMGLSAALKETPASGEDTTAVLYGTKLGHFKTSKLHFPMSERCERTSERTSEWPSTYVSILVGSRPQCAGQW